MESRKSEKKSEVWIKYCEACVTSKIQRNNRPHHEESHSAGNREAKL